MIEIDPKNPPKKETLTKEQLIERIKDGLSTVKDYNLTSLARMVFSYSEIGQHSLDYNGDGTFELTIYHPKKQ